VLDLVDMSNNQARPQKRIVKFLPRDERWQMEVREWKEVTPELQHKKGMGTKGETMQPTAYPL